MHNLLFMYKTRWPSFGSILFMGINMKQSIVLQTLHFLLYMLYILCMEMAGCLIRPLCVQYDNSVVLLLCLLLSVHERYSIWLIDSRRRETNFLSMYSYWRKPKS